jgi:hypothetical protein
LQRVLNSSPEFLIWGEHFGILKQIAAAYFTGLQKGLDEKLNQGPEGFRAREMQLRDPNRWTAWDNAISADDLNEAYRRFVMTLFTEGNSKHVRWGFKEIRYGWNASDKTLPFLHEIFPKAKTLIIFRDPIDTLRSMLQSWYRELDGSIDAIDKTILNLARLWVRQYERLFLFHHTFPSSSDIVRYEDLASSETRARITSFLSIQRQPNWDSVLSARVGESGKDDAFARLVQERLDANETAVANLTRDVQILYRHAETAKIAKGPRLDRVEADR